MGSEHDAIDLRAISERLAACEYAERCANGAGSFGTAEQSMLAEFREHATADVRALLDALEAERARAGEAERAVRDTFLAINHKAVKTAEIRPIARLAQMLREQMDDIRYQDIVEVLQDFYAVAEAVGAVHEQSMGKPHPGTREEVVAAIGALKSRALAAEAQRDARPDISRGDAAELVRLDYEIVSDWSPDGPEAALRVEAALREHAKGVAVFDPDRLDELVRRLELGTITMGEREELADMCRAGLNEMSHAITLRAERERLKAMVPSEEECDAISYCAKIACRDLVEESTIAEAYVERLEAARVEGEG